MANYKLINMNVILDEYLYMGYIGLNEHSLKKNSNYSVSMKLVMFLLIKCMI